MTLITKEAALSKWKLKWEDDLSPKIFQKLIWIKTFVFAFVLSSEKKVRYENFL